MSRRPWAIWLNIYGWPSPLYLILGEVRLFVKFFDTTAQTQIIITRGKEVQITHLEQFRSPFGAESPGAAS
jgi:hypothetical protein